MNFGKRDLTHIRGALFVFLLVLMTGASALWNADRHLSQLDRDKKLAENRLNEVVAKLTQVTTERENITRFSPQYQDLLARGIVGEERRLDWVESIERIREQQQIFSMRYVISPQKNFASAPNLTAQNFELKASDMALELNLLHEGKLFGFLDDLRREAVGFYLVDHCKVERVAPTVEMRYAPQLKAECVLNWLTLQEQKK